MHEPLGLGAGTEVAQDGPASCGPLAGTTVLDLSFMGPGPRCSRLLADYGASVVKVAPVPTRSSRQIDPPFFVYSADRGMRRARIDLKAEGGREAFLALAARADVIVESFRPGVAARLGIGYDDVARHNPAVVYCAVTGYGQTGPRARWAGHDLNYLAMGGYLGTSGVRADGGPALPGATVADAAAGGMQAALAVTTALVDRHRTGRGAYLDVAMVRGVVWLASLLVDEHLATGSEPRPGHGLLTGQYACYDLYRASDGGWLSVAAIEHRFFANLCRALDCERWAASQFDDAVQDELRRVFADAFARRTRDEWAAELSPAETCVAAVLSIAELADDIDVRARVVEATHPERGNFWQLGPLLAGMVPMTGPEREPVRIPDPKAADTQDLLAAAGVDGRTVACWLADGVIA